MLVQIKMKIQLLYPEIPLYLVKIFIIILKQLNQLKVKEKTMILGK